MKLPVLLVANAAVVDALLHVQGGGWDRVVPQAFPAYVQGFVVGIVEIESHERGTTPVLAFVVVDADGHVFGSSGSMIIDGYRASVLADGSLRQPFAMPFSVMVPAPGPIRVRVEGNGEPIGSVDFMVMPLSS